MKAYENIFDVFNNCTAKICDVSQGDGYLDDDISFLEIGSCEGDLQPYSGTSVNGTTIKEYGMYKDISTKLYCKDNDKLLKVGRVAVINGTIYDILIVEPWELGNVALMKERVN